MFGIGVLGIGQKQPALGPMWRDSSVVKKYVHEEMRGGATASTPSTSSSPSSKTAPWVPNSAHCSEQTSEHRTVSHRRTSRRGQIDGRRADGANHGEPPRRLNYEEGNSKPSKFYDVQQTSNLESKCGRHLSPRTTTQQEKSHRDATEDDFPSKRWRHRRRWIYLGMIENISGKRQRQEDDVTNWNRKMHSMKRQLCTKRRQAEEPEVCMKRRQKPNPGVPARKGEGEPSARPLRVEGVVSKGEVFVGQGIHATSRHTPCETPPSTWSCRTRARNQEKILPRHLTRNGKSHTKDPQRRDKIPAFVRAVLLLMSAISLCFGQSSPYDEFHYIDFREYVEQNKNEFYIAGGAPRYPNNPGFFSTEFLEYCDKAKPYTLRRNIEDYDITPNAPGMTVSSLLYGNVSGAQFLYEQMRNDPNLAALPENAYLLSDYQNNPFAGRQVYGNFTEANRTIGFIPEHFVPDLPYPHNRLQICHFALRLIQPGDSMFASVFRMNKAFVAHGFDTTFHFRILHRSEECMVAGLDAQWCRTKGADGFAFVIQNMKRDSFGVDRAGLGYSGMFDTLAIEFDTYRDWENDEDTENHIAVVASTRVGQPATANHKNSRLAETSDIPNLQEGIHKVRVVYEIQDTASDEYYHSTWFGDVESGWLELQANGRVGMLRIYLNDVKKLILPIDLSQVVNTDGLPTYKWDYRTINNADDDGVYPGRAYIGFTASIKETQMQAVDILDWHFLSTPPCTSDEIYCRITENYPRMDMPCKVGSDYTGGLLPIGPRGVLTEQYCKIGIRNLARGSVRVSADFEMNVRGGDSHRCIATNPAGKSEVQLTKAHTRDDVVNWVHIHPYFLGCNKTINYNVNVTELWITGVDGTRSLVVNDPHIMNSRDVSFRKRSMFEYCVIEHAYDPSRYYIADCNCEYCVRLFTMQSYYSVFYLSQCGARFGYYCRCLEVSDIGDNIQVFANLPPLTYIRKPICRGCTYHAHCNLMLKAGQCAQASEKQRIGTPLAPDPIHKGYVFGGDVGDGGYLRGDVCECTPGYQPYAYRSVCLPQDNIEILLDSLEGVSVFEPITVDECFAQCQKTLDCNYFAFWPPAKQPFPTPRGRCDLFRDCVNHVCNSAFHWICITGTVYKMEAIGEYNNEDSQRATPQLIYPLRGVQTTRYECFNCMRQFPEADCVFHCGEPVQVTFQHYPAGQSCGTCIFSGNYMHELNTNEDSTIKQCVYDAIEGGNDPWTHCQATVYAQGITASNGFGVGTSTELFNGVATHFMSECPGRDFEMFGAFCAPNVHAREYFTSFVLHHSGSKNNTIWPVEQFDCVNAICDLVSRDQCYTKLAVYDFEGTGTGLDQVGNLHLLPTGNPQIVQGQGLIFNKTMRDSFMVTPSLPKSDMKDVTIEVWATIPPEEGVTNVALNRHANSNAETGWFETYAANKALDQDLDTYWQSALFDSPLIEITFEIDFGRVIWAEGWIVHWKHRVQSYTMWTADEGWHGEKLDYVRLNQIVENNDYTNDFSSPTSGSFFRGRWMKLWITRLKDQRILPGEVFGEFCASIKELEVLSDRNLARLHPTNQTFSMDHRPAHMIDGDEQTYWSSPPGVRTATVMLEFDHLVQNITYTRLSWNWKPSFYTIYAFDLTCDQYKGSTPPTVGATYTASNVRLVTAVTSDSFSYDPEVYFNTYDARCVVFEITLNTLLDNYQTQIRELTALSFDPIEIRENVTVSYFDVPELYHIDNAIPKYVTNSHDNSDSTYFYTSATGSIVYDLDGPTELFRITLLWPTLDTVALNPSGLRVFYKENDLSSWTTAFSSNAVGIEPTVVVFPAPVMAAFVKIQVTQMNLFSGNRWALSEIRFYPPNALNQPAVYVKPVPEAGLQYEEAFFSTLFEKYPDYNQVDKLYADMNVNPVMPLDETDLYSGIRAIDNNRFTYALSTLGKVYQGGDFTWQLTVVFVSEVPLDVVVIEWRYRPQSIQLQCGSAFGSFDVLKSHDVEYYREYIRDWAATDGNTALCTSLKLLSWGTKDAHGDHNLIGIAEVRAYAYGVRHQIVGVHEFIPSTVTPLTTDSGRADLVANTNNQDFVPSTDYTSQPEWTTSSVSIAGESASNSAQRKQVALVLDLGDGDDQYWGMMVDMGSKYASEIEVLAKRPGVTNWYSLFTLSGKQQPGVEYLFGDFEAKYLKITFKSVGQELVRVGNLTTTTEGDATTEAPQYEYQSFTSYTLRSLRIFKSSNRALEKGTTATIGDRFLHTSEIAVNGNYSQAWLNYPGSTESMLMVNLLQKWEVIGGVTVHWWYPAKDFQLWYAPELDPITGLGEWFSLANFTNNIAAVTNVMTPFIGQYLKIIMTKSAHYDLAVDQSRRGQEIYGIYGLNVIFEKNVALGKVLEVSGIPLTSQDEVAVSNFAPAKAIDGGASQLATFWMPNPGLPDASYVVELDSFQPVAGIKMRWRITPDIFFVQKFGSGGWSNVTGGVFDFTLDNPVYPRQLVTQTSYTFGVHVGWECAKFRLKIEKKRATNQGDYMAALQNLWVFIPTSLASPVLTTKVQFSSIPNNPSASTQTLIGYEPVHVIDGSSGGNYWKAETGLRAAWIRLAWSELMYIGRVRINWRNPATHFVVETYNSADLLNVGWTIAYEWEGNTLAENEQVIYREAERLRLRIIDSLYDLAVYEIRVWGADLAMQAISRVYDEGSEEFPDAPAAFDSSKEMATDYNLNTLWMPPPTEPVFVATLDLKIIYSVVGVQMWWFFYPTRQIYYSTVGGSDTDNWFLMAFRSDIYKFGLQIAEIGVDFQVKNIEMRYLKMDITANYNDAPDLQFGCGLRNIYIYMDDNLGRKLPGAATSTWDYPLSLALDGNPNTYWAGRAGQRDTFINIDLEYLRNVAGLRLTFGVNWPDTIGVYRWDAAGNQWEERDMKKQSKDQIYTMASTEHFQTRYMRFYLKEPTQTSANVDDHGADHLRQKLLQIFMIEVFDHRGGGGLFGLENTISKQYSTITYSQYQPLQWNVASENNARSDTQLVILDEHKETAGQEVQIVVTFDRDGNIALYRNGERYGNIYNSPAVTWANEINTRLVFGVRSTDFYQEGGDTTGNANFPESDIGTNGDDRSPFFHGTIHRAAIMKGALLKAEVLGLYKVRQGTGKELGCHCFDACPVGSNKFFPHVPVPCSGSGACMRHPTGAGFAPGTCKCLPGYSGDACQYHCSETSQTGCCSIDDDCPPTFTCDTNTRSCKPAR